MKKEIQKYYVKDKCIIESKNEYKIIAQKFLAGILYKINASFIQPIREEQTNVYYSLDLQEIKELTNIYDIEYFKDRIDRVADELSTKITIKEKNRVCVVELFKKFDVNMDKKTIEIEIDKEILPLLKNKFEKYLKLGFKYISVLTSEYYVKLYENIILKANKTNKNEQNYIFYLNNLQEILNYKYTMYSHIRQFILSPAIEQFNQHQLFKLIKYEPVYEQKRKSEGRKKVMGINFIYILSDEVIDLYEKQSKESNNVIENLIIGDEVLKSIEKDKIIEPIIQSDEYKKLLELLPEIEREKELTKKIILHYFKEKDFDYVRSNILYTNEYNKIKKSYLIYLKQSLENDYGIEIRDAEQAKKKVVENKENLQKKEAIDKDNNIEKQKQQKENRIKANQYIDSLNNEDKEILKKICIDAMDEEKKKSPFFKNILESNMVDYICENIFK